MQGLLLRRPLRDRRRGAGSGRRSVGGGRHHHHPHAHLPVHVEVCGMLMALLLLFVCFDLLCVIWFLVGVFIDAVFFFVGASIEYCIMYVLYPCHYHYSRDMSFRRINLDELCQIRIEFHEFIFTNNSKYIPLFSSISVSQTPASTTH